jgi:hypothetical protein
VSRLSNTPGRDGTKFLGFIEVPLNVKANVVSGWIVKTPSEIEGPSILIHLT